MASPTVHAHRKLVNQGQPSGNPAFRKASRNTRARRKAASFDVNRSV